jgi:hypothetical protein
MAWKPDDKYTKKEMAEETPEHPALRMRRLRAEPIAFLEGSTEHANNVVKVNFKQRKKKNG